MNTADIHRMIAEAYELEGLLLLADNRGDDTPEYVFTAIGEKLSRLQALLANGTESKEAAPAAEELIKDEEPADKEDHASEEASEKTADDNMVYEMPMVEDVTANDSDEPVDDEQVVEIVINNEPEELGEEETPKEENEVEEEETEDDEEPAEETTEKLEEEPEDETEEEAEEDDEPTETEPHDDANLRLDEKLQRTRSKDLKSAFSLNDTFRFRRELFGNSGAVMTDALHLVEAMQSYDEAEDYFYGDLGWDRESDDVKEFMAIIKNHFL